MKAGNKYVLVIMDYASKWPEAYALKNMMPSGYDIPSGNPRGSTYR